MMNWNKFCIQMNINHDLIIKTIKFCFNYDELNSYFLQMINSIFVKNIFDVFTRVFENLKSFSTSITHFFVVAFTFIAFVNFDFIAFFANHVLFLIFRFQFLQNRMIVNVQHEHDQIKKEIQILQFDSSFFSDKEKSEESIKKNDRMIRTMIYFYLRHVRKIIDKNVKIFKKQLKFNKFNMFYWCYVFVP